MKTQKIITYDKIIYYFCVWVEYKFRIFSFMKFQANNMKLDMFNPKHL